MKKMMEKFRFRKRDSSSCDSSDMKDEDFQFLQQSDNSQFGSVFHDEPENIGKSYQQKFQKPKHESYELNQMVCHREQRCNENNCIRNQLLPPSYEQHVKTRQKSPILFEDYKKPAHQQPEPKPQESNKNLSRYPQQIDKHFQKTIKQIDRHLQNTPQQNDRHLQHTQQQNERYLQHTPQQNERYLQHTPQQIDRHYQKTPQRNNNGDFTENRGKQHTNWNGVLQDLFGFDSGHTAESTHESTSSGVASDVTSVFPTTPTLSTFKGGESEGSASSAKSMGSDQHSQDSGTRSASLPDSPKPKQQQKYINRHDSPVSPPPPPLPRSSAPLLYRDKPLPPLPTENTQNDNKMLRYTESPTLPNRGHKLNYRDKRNKRQTPENQSRSQSSGRHPQNQTNYLENAFVVSSERGSRSPVTHLPYNDIKSRYLDAYQRDDPSQRTSDACLNDHQISRPKSTPVIPSSLNPMSPNLSLRTDQLSPNELSHRDLMARQKYKQKLIQQKQNQQSIQPRYSSQILDMPLFNNSTQNVDDTSTKPKTEFIISNSLQGKNSNKSRLSPSALFGLNGHSSSISSSGDSHVMLTQVQVHNPGDSLDPNYSLDSNYKDLSSTSPEESLLGVSAMTSSHAYQHTVNGVPHSSRYPDKQGTIGRSRTYLNQFNQVDGEGAITKTKSKKFVHKLSPFESLPNDLLLKIFSHLPTDKLCRCAQVCRHWYNTVWDHPILWRSILINNPLIDIDRALKYLTRRLSYNTPKICMILERININLCSRLTDRSLQTVVKRCPELRCLDMQGCVQVSNIGVTEAVTRCVNLERMDVTGCPLVTCISLTETVITQSSSQHLQRIYLRYLDMTDCPKVSDSDLSTVTSQCTQLLFFYLRRCPLITDLGVSCIANNCISLRELSISDCKAVTDLGLRELAKLRDNLRYLSVAKCQKVSDQGVIHIARHCSKLRYLNVRGCESVTDTALAFLAQNCPRLKSLDVGKCDITDDGLNALSIYSPHLRKLSLKSCDLISDKGIVLVAYRCRSLQQLNVQDCCLSVEAYSMLKKYCRKALIEHTNPGFV